MKSNSALSFQAASLNRRSPRSGSITGSTSAHHALGRALPEPHIVLPQLDLRLQQLARLAHHAREHLDEGAAERRVAVEPVARLRPGRCCRARKSSTSLRLRSAMSPRMATTCSDWSASGCASCCSAMLAIPYHPRRRAMPRACRTGKPLTSGWLDVATLPASANSEPEQYAPVYVGKSPQIANGAVGLPDRRWSAPHAVIAPMRAVAGLALLLLLGACEPAAAPGQSPARPASPASYPDLAERPAAAQLSDTLEQRSEIGNQLAADRENAIRRAAELAYAAGRGRSPAARRRRVGAAAGAAAPPRWPTSRATRAWREPTWTAASTMSRDRGKLRQFMLRLGREAPDPAGPRSLAQALGLETPPDAPPAPVRRQSPRAAAC